LEKTTGILLKGILPLSYDFFNKNTFALGGSEK